MEVNTHRLVEEFQLLVSMDSVTFCEHQVAAYLKRQLKLMGMQVIEDHAGEYYHGTANNIYGFLKGTIPGAPILFSSHMDTVEPGLHKQAILHDDGTITSDSTTVLGADDVSGIVAIMEALRLIIEHKIPHRDIEVLFTIAEEAYIKGSEVFDFSIIKAKTAYILDLSGEIGEVATKAPTLISFQVNFQGKESHAGFAPELGIHAISMAADALSHIKCGHVDEQSTLNIGTIQGGVATNIVPKQCFLQGEIRSFEHKRALALEQKLQTICEESAAKYGGNCQMDSTIHLYAYEVSNQSAVIHQLNQAAKQLGIQLQYSKTFGGSDNNNFMRHGIDGVVLACGMHKVHTCNEYTRVSDLVKSTQIIKELMTGEE